MKNIMAELEKLWDRARGTGGREKRAVEEGAAGCDGGGLYEWRLEREGRTKGEE